MPSVFHQADTFRPSRTKPLPSVLYKFFRNSALLSTDLSFENSMQISIILSSSFVPSHKTSSIICWGIEKAAPKISCAALCTVSLCCSSVGMRSNRLNCKLPPEVRFLPLNGVGCSSVPSTSSGLSLSVPRSRPLSVPSP